MMSNISMVEANLPPGFRFHPKDDELVCDFLMKKVTQSESLLMIEVDLNKCEPWDIPETARVGGKEWYFYSQRDRKYATGLRTNRATASGYWKATGKDRPVLRKGTLVGMRKTLVFYQGRAPRGRKTDWIMHEFRVEGLLGPLKIFSHKEDWVLCRVFYKSREVVTKLPNSTGNWSHNDGGSSSSLPALMDSNFISFEQTKSYLLNDEEYHEQVPCFSIFSHDQTYAIDFPYNSLTQLEENYDNNNNILLADMTASTINYPLDHLSCDKKEVWKAILDQVTKIESNPSIEDQSPSSLGERSSDSFLHGSTTFDF